MTTSSFSNLPVGQILAHIVEQNAELLSSLTAKISNSSLTNLWVQVGDLNKLTVVTQQEYVIMLFPDKDHDVIELLKTNLPADLISSLYTNLNLRITELWEVTARHTGKSFDDFIAEYRKANQEVWCIDRLTGEVWLTLPKDDFYAVCFSRTFPLLSRQEVSQLSQKTVFFSGLSTGSPVVLDLVGLGLGRVIGIDPDLVNLSNIRMGIGDKHVGYAKAVWLGYQISQLNPYCEIEVYPHGTDEQTAEEIIQRCDLICEMTDAFANKVNVRRVARKYGKTVCMGSGFGEQPSFSFETPADTLFLRDLTEDELVMLSDAKSDPIERAKKAIEIVGVENLSLRALLNFIIVAKLGYWAQLKTTASTVGGSLGYAMAMQLVGAEVTKETNISLIDIFVSTASQQHRNQHLFAELQQDERCAELLNPYSSLETAVKDLLQKIFSIHIDL